MSEDGGYGSVLGQITFAPDYDDEHLLVLALKMFVPLTELIERLLIIDGVTEHSDAGIVEEEVSQVVDGSITSGVPNIELNSLTINFDQLGIIL